MPSLIRSVAFCHPQLDSSGGVRAPQLLLGVQPSVKFKSSAWVAYGLRRYAGILGIALFARRHDAAWITTGWTTDLINGMVE